MSKQLAEILIKDRVITPQQVEEVQPLFAKDPERGPIFYLIEKKIISEAKLLAYLSQKFSLTSINLAKFEIKPEIIKLLTPELARKYRVIPIQANERTVVVAISDPTVIQHFDDLKFRLKLSVESVLTSFSVFFQALDKYYPKGGIAGMDPRLDKLGKTTMVKTPDTTKMTKKVGDMDVSDYQVDETMVIEMVRVHEIDSGAAMDDAPVIRVVNGLLGETVRRGASDIHFESYEKRCRVRLRIDGVLHEIAQIPMEMKRAVIARLKIMSQLDIAETRVPQDGRIKLKAGGKEIDFRVNSMPTLYGEKIVLRMLSTGSLELDLKKLGFEQEQLTIFEKGIYAPNGMVLVTGPTGSGKTTTLYSALSALNKITDNISTAEDPVEYNLEGANQVQINKEIGLTFASVLRALLRQDPDIILVGEIRDYETAEVAVQAALTGHLVLSTLHTNDAPSTITRLMNMGLEPFLVVASLNNIVAQRLLRRICPHCKEDYQVQPQQLIDDGVPEEIVATAKFSHGKGCTECNNVGTKGRVAIYEVLDFSNNLKDMVLRGESVMALRKQAIAEGMKTLRMAALTKAMEGMVTLEEALALTMEG